MLLKEVFDQLAVAELNNINVVDQETKQIDPLRYGQVITAINAGLTELHSRQYLRKGVLKVHLIPGQELYVLDSRYNLGGKGAPPEQLFLEGVPSYKNDLLKIHRVVDDKDQELGINTNSSWFAVATPAYNQLYVPETLQSKHGMKVLTVHYRQNHRMIPTGVDEVDPECYGLALERTHLWALCLFVASRMHMPVGLQDATYSGNSYMAQFNTQMVELSGAGLQLADMAVNHGVRLKGYP